LCIHFISFTPLLPLRFLFLFFSLLNDPATTEIYTLSLHDALPICADLPGGAPVPPAAILDPPAPGVGGHRAHLRAPHAAGHVARSEEHTSELQSRGHLVCRLLLEKKKQRPPCSKSLSAPPPAPHTV